MTTGTETQQVQDAVARLWSEGRRTSLDRVDTIETTVAGLLLGQPVELDKAVAAAHRLAGTLGMFGLPGGSTLALEIENTLEGPPLDALALDELSDLVVELRASVEGSPEHPGDIAPAVDRRVLQLVGAERSYSEVLQLLAKSRGLEVDQIAAEEIESAGQAEVIVVDCRSVRPCDLPTTIGAKRKLVVAIGTPADVAVRRELCALGFDLVLPATLDAERALELIVSQLGQRSGSGRVSMVQSGPNGTSSIDLPLPGWSLNTVTVGELFTLPRGPGDLLVIDAATMDPDAAVDLCRSIRLDPTTSGASVLVVLAGNEPPIDLVGRLLAAEVDDVVWSDGDDLAVRVLALSRRSMNRTAESPRPSSPLDSDEPLVDVLQARVEAAFRAKRPLSVVFVTPRRLAEVNETHGREAGDQLLAEIGRVVSKHFRTDDVLGRWGAGFVLALDVDRKVAAERLAGLSAELDRTDTELTGAAALLGEDASDGETLIQLAARWARSATDVERSGVIDNPSRSILLVEDDPLIATLISDLLASQGHEVEVVTDGPSAAELASHPTAADRYKLVVLDVSLPGLDGFGVLRRMKRVSSAVPVVLVTARATEAEVLAGLELGAIDHIAKPFSPLVLIRRLERVLAP